MRAFAGAADPRLDLNSRAGGFDTECEVAQLRDVLLARYLGVPRAVLARARAGADRLIPVIEALNALGRLRPIRPERPGWWSAAVSACRLGDPAYAGESWRLIKDRRRAPRPHAALGPTGWTAGAAPGKVGYAPALRGDGS